MVCFIADNEFTISLSGHFSEQGNICRGFRLFFLKAFLQAGKRIVHAYQPIIAHDYKNLFYPFIHRKQMYKYLYELLSNKFAKDKICTYLYHILAMQLISKLDGKMKTLELATPIAFLNGTIGLDDFESDLFSELSELTPLLVDDLFNHPEKLALLIKENVKTIVLQTTGRSGQAISDGIDFLSSKGFTPENIVLIFPQNSINQAERFVKSSPDTKIFSWWKGELELEN